MTFIVINFRPFFYAIHFFLSLFSLSNGLFYFCFRFVYFFPLLFHLFLHFVSFAGPGHRFYLLSWGWWSSNIDTSSLILSSLRQFSLCMYRSLCVCMNSCVCVSRNEVIPFLMLFDKALSNDSRHGLY